MNADGSIVVLRGGGAALVLDIGSGVGDRLPVVLHWGADPGADFPGLLGGPDFEATAWTPARARSAADVPVPRRLIPLPVDGWRLRPGLAGARWDGTAFSPHFTVEAFRYEPPGDVKLTAVDAASGLRLEAALHLHPGGVLETRYAVRNDGDSGYGVQFLGATLPLPARAQEILDLTGRWCRERIPQRHPLPFGTWSRETRHGRTGHDATLVLAVGTPGFAFRTGEVWAVHLGWSGDAAYWAERSPDGHAGLGAGALLAPGEVVLGAGETSTAPPAYAAYSAAGLDGLSAAYHSYVRARPGSPRRPRPVVLNTWEAVYFDHDLARLTALAEVATEVGVERFVLDDGWFLGRRDDTAGLGDWTVDPEVWPHGLTPLIDRVRALGMEFGLWVEPEMVNVDSELYRAHPDWVLRPEPGGALPVPWRHQQVLDLTNPAAYAHVLESLDSLLTDNVISYLKWDHNRDLIEAGSAGRAAGHAQTGAVYALLDALRHRHPGVEIESCSSGGARMDLGILARTDRVWASDTNDPLERQAIQRWTGQLLPPELIGAHVGPPRAHTTGRTATLSFRVATAVFGSFGLEWDIASTSPEERAALTVAVAFYRRMRELLHSGQSVRADYPDDAGYLHGVVAADRSAALFSYVALTASAWEVPPPALLPGLDPDRRYRVTPVHPAGEPLSTGAAPPPWYAAGGVTASGRALGTLGLALPILAPEQALLLHVTAADGG